MSETTTSPLYYALSAKMSQDFATRPRISGPFAIQKRLWDGRKVAVVAISRGNHRQRTDRKVYYGTLVLAAGDENQIGVRHSSGEVTIIHKSRAVDVYDMTRTKPATTR